MIDTKTRKIIGRATTGDATKLKEWYPHSLWIMIGISLGFIHGQAGGSAPADLTKFWFDVADTTHGPDGTLKKHNGSAWVATTGVVSNAGVTIPAGSVGTTQLADNAVTTAKIPDNAVTTAKIPDSAITSDKLANSGVTAGSYSNPTFTVDAKGRLTAAANGGGFNAPWNGTQFIVGAYTHIEAFSHHVLTLDLGATFSAATYPFTIMSKPGGGGLQSPLHTVNYGTWLVIDTNAGGYMYASGSYNAVRAPLIVRIA